MELSDVTSYHIPYATPPGNEQGFHVRAALGGGLPHQFRVDTGSVGVVVPRSALGPDYQDFDPSRNTQFGYVSSGKMHTGQWVEVPVVLGVPKAWDGTGDYPVAQIDVFAVDPGEAFTGGMLGIGFAIGDQADGGAERNALLHLTYMGQPLSQGYIVGSQGIDAGLTPENADGFTFVALARNAEGDDWMQPVGTVDLPGFDQDLSVLIDTGIEDMLLWVADPDDQPGGGADPPVVPPGVRINVTIQAPNGAGAPALQYSFLTGDTTDPMAPSAVRWRKGRGSVNTGIRVLAGHDYLYDAAAGRLGLRPLQA